LKRLREVSASILTGISSGIGYYLCELPLRHWGASHQWDRRNLHGWVWRTVGAPAYAVCFIVLEPVT